MPDSVSPGRFLQAGSFLSKADDAYETIVSRAKDVPVKVQVGPTFDLVMYTIFSGGIKSHGSGVVSSKVNEITWKEEFARCQIKIWRVNALGALSCVGDAASADIASSYDDAADAYQYILTIRESFKDGRYHDREEEKQQTRALDISSVTRLFFSASGRLLQIEESRSPVLVFKLNTALDMLRQPQSSISLKDKIAGNDDNSDTDDGLSDAEQATENSEPNLFSADHVEWIAFEQYITTRDDNTNSSGSESDFESSESEPENDDYVPTSSELITSKLEKLGLSKSTEAPPDNQQKARSAVVKKHKQHAGELSLLEYIVRLAALQANDQESVENIHDERIALYLQDESSQGQRQQQQQQQLKNWRNFSSVKSSRVQTEKDSKEVDNNGTDHDWKKTSRGPKQDSLVKIDNNSSSQKLATLKSDTGSDNKLPSRLTLTPWEQDRLNTKRQLLLLKRKENY